jgi:hypothetical protein
MASSKSSPLLAVSSLRLYDPVCMLDIPQDVAHGYLVLLSGGQPAFPTQSQSGPESQAPIIDEAAISLAFASLRDGNVIDACLGTPTLPQGTSPPASALRQARSAKLALSDAADSEPTVQRLAVETYANAFRIVEEYNIAVARLNLCTRCCYQATIHRRAELDLASAFQHLCESVAAHTVV